MGDECEWKREPLFQTLMKTYKTVFIFILRRCMNRIVIGTITLVTELTNQSTMINANNSRVSAVFGITVIVGLSVFTRNKRTKLTTM